MLSVKQSEQQNRQIYISLSKMFDFEVTMKQVSFGEDVENASSQGCLLQLHDSVREAQL